MSGIFNKGEMARFKEGQIDRERVRRAGHSAQPRPLYNSPENNSQRFDYDSAINHTKLKKNLYLVLGFLPTPVFLDIINSSTTENLGFGVLLSMISLGAALRFFKLDEYDI